MPKAKHITRLLALVLITLACGKTPAGPPAPPPVDSSYVPLFDGRSLAGWKTHGGQATYRAEDGCIVGRVAPGRLNSFLCTEKTFGDFILRLEFKSLVGNSGLYFRVDKGGYAGVLGFQAEVDPQNNVGGIYETAGRQWVAQPKPEEVKKWLKPKDWNELAVVALGRRVVVELNGRVTADLKNDPGRTEGHIALQLHGGQDMDVWFKDVELLEIAPR